MDPQIEDFAAEVTRIVDRKRKYNITIYADGKPVAEFETLYLFRRHGSAILQEHPRGEIEFKFEYE